MTSRRNAVIAMATGVLTSKKRRVANPPTPQIILSKEAYKRLVDILESGGVIHTISYSLPSTDGRVCYGTSYLTNKKERDWKIKK